MKNLLLLHGALGHSCQFEELARKLSQNYAVHTLLFSGHGDIPIPDKGVSVGLYTQQLHAYLEKKNLAEVIIFGYSLGGYVALNHAINFPGKITSIITLAAKFNWNPEIAQQEAKMLDANIIKEKVPKYAAQLAAIHGQEKWEHLLSAIAVLMKDLGGQNLLSKEQLSGLNIPVQYMVGDKDVMVSIDETREKFQQTPHATLAVLPDTRHPFEKVDVDLLTTLIHNFSKKN